MAIDRRFQEKALRLADEVGIEKAAEELRIPESTLLKWRQNVSPRPVIPVLSHVRREDADPRQSELRQMERAPHAAKRFPVRAGKDTDQ